MVRRKLATVLCLTISCTVLVLPNDLAAHASPSPVLDPHGPPPPPPENPPPAPPDPAAKFRREEVENFIAAYLEAARASDPGSEVSLFADRVDYLGRPDTSQLQIRQDLARQQARWPERDFKRLGQAAVETLPNGQLRVTLLLHFDFRHEHEQASGDIVRIFLLEPEATHSFRIVGLSERKSTP